MADIDGAAAQAVADEIICRGGRAAAVRCDVADPEQQQAAFQSHMQRFRQLDYALLNAGPRRRCQCCQPKCATLLLQLLLQIPRQ